MLELEIAKQYPRKKPLLRLYPIFFHLLFKILLISALVYYELSQMKRLFGVEFEQLMQRYIEEFALVQDSFFVELLGLELGYKGFELLQVRTLHYNHYYL